MMQERMEHVGPDFISSLILGVGSGWERRPSWRK